MPSLTNLRTEDYMAISRAMDTNRNNRIDTNEANVSGSAQSQIGNANGVVGTREFAKSLESGDIFLNALSPATADKVADYFSKHNENFDRPVAEWISDAWVSKADFTFSDDNKAQIDRNGDNKVSAKELATALTSGALSIGRARQTSNDPFANPQPNRPVYGNDPFANPQPHRPVHGSDPFANPQPHRPVYGNDPFQKDPFRPDRPNNGVSLDRAQSFARNLHNNKMKTDIFGNYTPGSGALRPNEANTEIKNFLESQVIESRSMSLRDKLTLLSSEMMDTDVFGNYDLYSGSLKMGEASDLASKAANFEKDRMPGGNASSAREFIQLIESKTVELDIFGNEAPGTGIISHRDGRNLIKDFIENTVVRSPRLSVDDKLNIIKNQQMAQDMFGNYDVSSGTLTVDDANRLAREALRY